jgi:hypothetical protein
MKRVLVTAIISMIIGVVLGVVGSRRFLPPSGDQVMTYINNLSMGEFKEFARQMNAHLGFQALPQQFLPVTPPEGTK